MPTLTRIIALFLITLATAALIPIAGCSQETGGYQTLSPTQALEMIRTDSSLLLLDVRTSQEFAGEMGYLKGAQLLPVQELEERIAELEPFRNRPILVYCRSGNRSSGASELLSARGFRVMMLDGGMLAWNKAELPIEKNTKGGDAE